MIVSTITNLPVSIVKNTKVYLEDSNSERWYRDAQYDTNECAAFSKMVGNKDTMLLTRDELSRICRGDDAINTPITVDEMRVFISTLDHASKEIANQWPDQALREFLADADENGTDVRKDVIRRITREIEANKPPEKPQEGPPEATGERRAPKTARSTPRPRKQEGSVSVALGEASVLLTPKQLEFMERLSECPDWSSKGPTGEYVASDYAQELSDTMNPMSMGAVLTTLREKNLLQTEKRRVGAIKCCVFKLTDLGVQVYNKLAGKGE